MFCYYLHLLLCYYYIPRINYETSTIEYYLTSYIQQVQKKQTKQNKTKQNKNRNRQNYYSEILGVNIHDGYINGVALWTFAVITWSKTIILTFVSRFMFPWYHWLRVKWMINHQGCSKLLNCPTHYLTRAILAYWKKKVWRLVLYFTKFDRNT